MSLAWPAVREVWLVTGIPGAGKSTVARELAAALPAAAHIEGDALADWIIRGRVLPGEQPAAESERQIALNVRNQCLLAQSFAAAGFVPIIDYVIVDRARLAAYQAQLPELELFFVMLTPGKEVALQGDRNRTEKTVAAQWTHLEEIMRRELLDTGLWLDNRTLNPAETVRAILDQREQARLCQSY